MAQEKAAEIIKFKAANRAAQKGAPDGGAPVSPLDSASNSEQAAGSAPVCDDFSHQETGEAAIAETVGATLAAARIEAGHSVGAISEAIKVKAAHLQSIEAMRADLLPPMPYVIGFIKSYSAYLGIDGDALASRFRQEVGAGASVASDSMGEPRYAPQADDEGARLVSLFAIGAILLFGFWVVFQIASGGGDDAPAQAAPEFRVRLGEAPATAPVLRPSLSPTALPSSSQVAGVDQAPVEEIVEDISEIADVPTGAATDPASEVTSDENVSTTAQSAPPTEDAVAVSQAATTALSPPEVIVISAPEAVAPAVPERVTPSPAPTPPVVKPVIVSAELTRSIAPNYPNRCTRRAAELEQVTVRFNISAAGRVEGARVVSSTNDCFEGEAVGTLARWRFTPRTIDGAAVAETGKTATLNFRK